MVARVFARWAILWLGMLVPAVGAELPFSYNSSFTQLPKSVCPLHYDLHLEPDLEKLTTHGTVTIRILAMQRVSEIVLNSLDLEITHASLQAEREMVLHPRLDAAQQTLTLPLPEPIVPGSNYELTIEFNGHIGAQAQGLFLRAGLPGGRAKENDAGDPDGARRRAPDVSLLG